MKCCVPFCKTEYKSSTFGIPKASLDLWENALGMKLKANFRICQKHFKEEDIIRTWVSGTGLNKYVVCILT